jgi:hypothetical protein
VTVKYMICVHLYYDDYTTINPETGLPGLYGVLVGLGIKY